MLEILRKKEKNRGRREVHASSIEHMRWADSALMNEVVQTDKIITKRFLGESY